MRVLRPLTTVAFTLFIVAATLADSAVAAEKGLLLIKVELGILNDEGSDISELFGVEHFELMNLTTKQAHTVLVSNSRVSVEEVDEGVYCLNSLRMARSSIDLMYCGEPYFKVVAGRVNNAGLWRYGVSFPRHRQRLLFGARYLDGVLDEAKGTTRKRC